MHSKPLRLICLGQMLLQRLPEKMLLMLLKKSRLSILFIGGYFGSRRWNEKKEKLPWEKWQQLPRRGIEQKRAAGETEIPLNWVPFFFSSFDFFRFFTFVHFLIRSSIKCIFHFPSMTWSWWGRRSLRVKIENGKCGPGRKTALKSTLKQCSLSLEFNLRN